MAWLLPCAEKLCFQRVMFPMPREHLVLGRNDSQQPLVSGFGLRFWSVQMRLYWVHFPKCGSSFINTLAHMPGTIAASRNAIEITLLNLTGDSREEGTIYKGTT